MASDSPEQGHPVNSEPRSADAIRQEMRAYKAQFSRVWISGGDFDEASRFVTELHVQNSQDIQRALLVAAVIAYARPFTENGTGDKKESIPSLPVNLGKVLQPEQQVLHEKILALRNQAVAHSDYSRRSAQWSFGQGNGYMTWAKPFDMLQEVTAPAELKEIALVMKAWCAHKLQALNLKLIGCQKQLGEFQPLDG